MAVNGHEHYAGAALPGDDAEQRGLALIAAWWSTLVEVVDEVERLRARVARLEQDRDAA